MSSTQPPYDRVGPDDIDPDDVDDVEELAREADERNPEPITRREALELELEEQGRSDEGSEVAITDVVDDRDTTP